MENYLPFVIIGLTTGSLYGIAALGLVLTYRTSGVFNFAQGAVGMVMAFVFYSLTVELGLPVAVAIPLVVVVGAPLFGLVLDRVLLRRLAEASSTTLIVVPLGLLVALQGLAMAVWGATPRYLPSFLPTETFSIGTVNVGYDQVIIVGIAVVCLIGLLVLLRSTHIGISMRAVVDDEPLTELMGTDARRGTTVSWMLGLSFASLAGLLLAPIVGLDVAVLTLLVVQAFGAAAIGRFANLTVAYGGALLIGVAAALSTKYVATIPELTGVPNSLPFIALLLVLLVGGRKKWFVELKGSRSTSPRSPRRPRVSSVLIVCAGIVFASIVPWVLPASRLLTFSTTLVFVLVFSSLRLLVGFSRLVSLAHVAFFALGATTLTHLLNAGVPFVPALVLAGLVLMALGGLIAIPAIRLSGLFLALATLGFGVLVQYLVFPTGLAFGSSFSIVVPRPDLVGIDFQDDKLFYLFVLVVVSIGAVLVEVVVRSRLGRLLRAGADSDVALESVGVSPTISRVLAFSISAGLAGIAGGMFGSLIGSASPESFDWSQSLLWVTVLVTAGAVSFRGSLLAALLLVTFPAFVSSPSVTEWLPVGFGLAAIVLAQVPDGLAGALQIPNALRVPTGSSRRRAATAGLADGPPASSRGGP